LFKVYPSSLSFSVGDYYQTKYESGCWRYQQFAIGGPRNQIDERYQEIGNLHEENHAKSIEAQREVPFKRLIAEDVQLSGRVDFLLKDSIDECKSSFGKTAVQNAVKGKPEASHLAQLVCYLLEFGFSQGRLIYGYYEQGSQGYVRKTQAIVPVTIIDGSVLVNGQHTGHKAEDLVNTILKLSQYLKDDVPAPRPASGGYSSPCRYCPISSICDSNPTSIQQHRAEAHSLIASKSMPSPKIVKEKG
jgi:CRISPR/Cas system-associated exonuclease Cas4 (RecB family)